MRSIPRAVSLLCLALAPLAAQELKLPTSLAAQAAQTVDVTLDTNMLQFASKFLSDKKPEEAQARKIIAGLKAIYVRSFEFDKPKSYSDADIETIRANFRGQGWSRMIGVQSKKEGENAEVFIRNDSAGKVSGLGVIASEARELTVVSIVGVIDPDQLGDLAGKFGIPSIVLEHKKPPAGKDE